MPRFLPTDPRRKAAILYVVIVLLTLFLVVGLAFVLYAESQSNSARIYREAEMTRDLYPSPEELLGWSVGALTYGADDTAATTATGGLFNAIRGHSLSQSIYGFNYTFPNGGPQTFGNEIGLQNTTAYNGAGRFHASGQQAVNPFGLDDFNLINATVWGADNFKLYPERDNTRTAAAPFGNYIGGSNAPYTYPDMNNVFLAALNGSGQLLAQSFWRDPLQQFTLASTAPYNPANLGQAQLNNWFVPDGPSTPGFPNNPGRPLKYLSMRPRPGDQLFPSEQRLSAARIQAMSANGVIFPAPQSLQGQGQGGDVINLPGGTENDSVWVDLGYPVVKLKVTNRKIKPMFAFLIVDLDGRVNMNVSGNVRESAQNTVTVNGNQTAMPFHGSAQGWGRWEINPRQILSDRGAQLNPQMAAPYNSMTNADLAYLGLFAGTSSTASLAVPRYGRFGLNPVTGPPYNPSQMPDANGSTFSFPNSGATQLPPGGRTYSPVDWDGSARVPAGAPAPAPNHFTLNQNVPNSILSPFPSFTTRYQSYLPTPSQGSQFEQSAHPSLFNPFNLNLNNGNAGNPALVNDNLPVGDMFSIMSGSPQNSVLGQLLFDPNTGYFALANNPKAPFLLTTYSMDLDRNGSAPGQADAANSLYQLNAALPHDRRFPSGQPTTFAQSIANVNSAPPNNPVPSDMRGPTPIGTDWRSLLGDWGRVDLNRPLLPYPTPQVAGTQYNLLEQQAATSAINDRVRLAQDIHQRFMVATGAGTPSPSGGIAIDQNVGGPTFEAQRFLAQLAVNIVDFIDDDDFITPFNWMDPNGQIAGSQNLNTSGWVFGTEMPRIVVNEVYAQVENDRSDPFPGNPGQASYQAPGGGVGDPDTAQGDAPTLPFPPPPYTGRKASKPYRVNFFVELHNPHQNDAGRMDNGAARLQLADQTHQPIYQVVIQSHVDTGDTNSGLRSASNVDGTPASAAAAPPANQRINLLVNNFDPDQQASPAPGPVPQPPAPTQPNPQDKYTYLVMPANGAYNAPASPQGQAGSNQGFYVIGPSKTKEDWESEFPHKRQSNQATPPPFSPTLMVQDDSMSASIDNQANLPRQAGQPHNLTGWKTTVLLRRLATPLMPATTNPQQANYNPFVTVDYVDGVQLNDAILYDSTGPCDGQNGNPVRQPLEQRFSFGRRQPFRASGLTAQTPNYLPASPVQARNTFFYQNGQDNTGQNPGDRLDQPFQWYAHMDRKLSNTMEILNVSMYKPHELTQQFINSGTQTPPAPPQTNAPAALQANQMFKHLAPWFDYDPQQPGVTLGTRLSRCLEMLGTRDNTAGSSFGGRVMGKVNINSIWDIETFRAVCDAQGGNFFSQTNNVDVIWQSIINKRSSYVATINGRQTNAPDPQNQKDQPFWSLAIPNAAGQQDTQYPYPSNPRGLNRGLLTDSNPAQASAPLFDVTANPPTVPTHPYVQKELLEKVFSHFTTRSNGFAVFVTTSFFHVRDDSDPTRPPLLGGEVDPALRHQFFAVVDRTNLTLNVNQLNPSDNNPRLQGPRPIFMPFTPMQGQQQATMADPGPVVMNVVPWYGGMGPNGGFLARDTVDHFGQPYSATSGDQFEIIPNKTTLFVDVGIDAEPVLVTGIQQVMIGGVQTAQVQLTDDERHFNGCAVCTQLLGNPGPQPLPINFEQPATQYGQSGYNAVVPYRLIIK